MHDFGRGKNEDILSRNDQESSAVPFEPVLRHAVFSSWPSGQTRTGTVMIDPPEPNYPRLMPIAIGTGPGQQRSAHRSDRGVKHRPLRFEVRVAGIAFTAIGEVGNVSRGVGLVREPTVQ